MMELVLSIVSIVVGIVSIVLAIVSMVSAKRTEKRIIKYIKLTRRLIDGSDVDFK